MVNSITENLGIYGWAHLDPILLAALAMEAPLLLVGDHGTGKSLLIERVASALEQDFRHYNASLLNYDDLVGIPIPENGSLRFIATPGAIWEAEFVFFDEISRCRPDLQNKLFPIIHERKVAGIPLERLKHRWAAMNPPAGDDFNNHHTVYFGAEPIDPALADRFLFIVRVPNWDDLSLSDHQKILSGNQPQRPTVNFQSIVFECIKRVNHLQKSLRPRVVDYVLTYLDLLSKCDLPQSGRRARMLADGILATYAAQQCLFRRGANLESSASIATRMGIPQNASEFPPSIVKLTAAHKQAWEISHLTKDNRLRRIFREPDRYQRLLIADEYDLPDGMLSKLITQALSQETCEARLTGISVILLLKYQLDRDFPPATWELLASRARRVLELGEINLRLPPGKDLEEWQKINAWAAIQPNTARAQLERNFIFAGFPELWRHTPWEKALQQFRADLDKFKIGF